MRIFLTCRIFSMYLAVVSFPPGGDSVDGRSLPVGVGPLLFLPWAKQGLMNISETGWEASRISLVFEPSHRSGRYFNWKSTFAGHRPGCQGIYRDNKAVLIHMKFGPRACLVRRFVTPFFLLFLFFSTSSSPANWMTRIPYHAFPSINMS